ncbi:glycerol-3-phosphate acyltransferase [[Acholeplasma] multilocale]|uniref:glycerol-3-phosphate acyltransferase n=1 Tax=[Acholeplasma] multilocale TaxID=264638 RepID=UPI0009FE8BB5|nr:glycerol-3-phosphate acyltransferase [[Acholeplasma] multilocale]
MHYLGIILACIFGYFMGAVSWSLIIVYWRRGIDVRTTGSGNAGATNTTRILGKRWGLVVTFLDGFKVVFTALFAVGMSAIPSPLFSETSFFIPCIFALIGHCYPVYYKFKGGKAVSCFLGLLFVINWMYLLVFLAVWFIAVSISRKVSVASIAAATVIGIIIWIPYTYGIADAQAAYSTANLWNAYGLFEANPSGWYFAWFNAFHLATDQNFASSILEMQIVILLGFGILAWRHFPNMKRIKAKTEPETFPKMTEEEKIKRHQDVRKPKPTKEERIKLKQERIKQKRTQ